MSAYTLDEAWSTARPRNHWYNDNADFALRMLGAGAGHCLVIGSPLFEASELADAGWAVTYLDYRSPPALDSRIAFVQHDACALPFAEASFDAASSACVLCHVGMGRYGDPIVEAGDARMLAEIARVLRPGGTAAITFGPVGETESADDSHRIYTLHAAQRMVAQAGLSEQSHEITRGYTLDYLSMLLRRI